MTKKVRARMTPTDTAATPTPGATVTALPVTGESATHPVAVLQYGGLSKRATIAEQLALPVVRELRIQAFAVEALDRAATERKGFALIGEKGTGKTMAVDAAVEDFLHNERERQRDQGYQPRHIVRVLAPRSRKAIEVLDAVYRALTGDGLVLKERGVAVMPDQLTASLVQELVNAEAAVVVVDEAENLSDIGLQVFRDIISAAETSSARRYEGGGKYRAAGVGVLLVGTHELRARLQSSDEHGRRWIHEYKADHLPVKQVAMVYRRFLPCCEAEAARRGDAAWITFLRETIAPASTPIARIENHVRHYVRRLVNSDPQIVRVDQVPFVEAVFLGTWTEIGGDLPSYAP